MIHHVTRNRDDLLPSCGQVPGPEALYSSTGERYSQTDLWHTIHIEAAFLVAHCAVGHGTCRLCLDVANEQRSPTA